MSKLDEASLVAGEGEYLDPGYDRQTPDGDNLLTDFCRADVELWTSWGDAIGAECGAGEDDGTVWVDSGSASVFGNPVLWTRPMDDASAEQAVEHQAAAFARRDGGAYLLYSAYPTPNLTRFGLQPVGHPPCMVRVPEVVRNERPTAVGLDVQRVREQRTTR